MFRFQSSAYHKRVTCNKCIHDKYVIIIEIVSLELENMVRKNDFRMQYCWINDNNSVKKSGLKK